MPKKTNKAEGYLPVARERAVHITVYDLQGGPIDPYLVEDLASSIERTLLEKPSNKNLAIDVKVV